MTDVMGLLKREAGETGRYQQNNNGKAKFCMDNLII
jgi:hypothetical protein